MKKGVLFALFLNGLLVAAFSQTDADFEYSENGGKITITGYRGSVKEVKIPERINGLPVTSIGEKTFSGNQLTSVTIPDSVTSIGERAFAGSFSFSTYEITYMNLTNVTIGNGVTSIGREAFAYCNKLTSVTIPDSVTTIGGFAFSSCNKLTSVTIPNSITSIGERAFYNCPSLASVTFKGTITSGNFHADAFRNLGDLRDKFYTTNAASGTPGTYTTTAPIGESSVWTKQ
ncbi:MAG: leucine-rich repeat domain-containing protein [Treponema sp.]|jgi:hypothetical protein|nr:leucine-rich repeat domain-containing protein [Treponema sp.]